MCLVSLLRHLDMSTVNTQTVVVTRIGLQKPALRPKMRRHSFVKKLAPTSVPIPTSASSGDRQRSLAAVSEASLPTIIGARSLTGRAVVFRIFTVLTHQKLHSFLLINNLHFVAFVLIPHLTTAHLGGLL